MSKPIRVVLIFILFGMFFLVRAYETDLFYDPLIEYFQNDYLHKPIPKMDSWSLVIHMLFRYTINSLISLGIIHLIFQNRKYVKFSGLLFIIAFVIIIGVFSFLLKNNFEWGYLLPFYLRRFIIHPLFLIILLPAFYYHKRQIE